MTVTLKKSIWLDHLVVSAVLHSRADQNSTKFSSVQFKMVSMCLGVYICAPPRLSGVSAMLHTVQIKGWTISPLAAAQVVVSGLGKLLPARSQQRTCVADEQKDTNVAEESRYQKPVILSHNKGFELTGADAIYRQRSEGQSLCLSVSLHLTVLIQMTRTFDLQWFKIDSNIKFNHSLCIVFC